MKVTVVEVYVLCAPHDGRPHPVVHFVVRAADELLVRLRTDAAGRSEREGWLGHSIPEDCMRNFDTARFWSKWCDDLGDSQRPDGQRPVISPLRWRGGTYDPYGMCPVWWSHYALIPRSLYWFCDGERAASVPGQDRRH